MNQNEIDWLSAVSKTDISDANLAKAAARQEARETFLKSADTFLNDMRGTIDKAQVLEITNIKEPTKVQKFMEKFGRGATGKTETIKWRADDNDIPRGLLDNPYAMREDVSVDSNKDIGKDTQPISDEAVAAMRNAFERILEVQQRMELQIDGDGAPLFSDDDIRREVWTPLVRSGLIPDNLVPDKFSEHAKAMEGAKELYQDKLAAFSKSHTAKGEKVGQAFRVVKETVSLGATFASGVVSAANAEEAAKLDQDLLTEKAAQKVAEDALENPGITNQQKAELEAARDAADAAKKAIWARQTELDTVQKAVTNSTLLLTGFVGIGEMVADHVHAPADQKSLDKWVKTIDVALNLAAGIASASADLAMRTTLSKNEGGLSAESKGLIGAVTAGIKCGFTGSRLATAGAMIFREPDPKKQAAGWKSLLEKLASSVEAGIKAAAQKSFGDGDKDQQAKLNQVAAACKLAITQAATGPQLVEAIKNNDRQGLMKLLGGTVVGATFAGALGATSELMADAARADVSLLEELNGSFHASIYTESDEDEAIHGRVHDNTSAGIMDALTGNIGAINDGAALVIDASSAKPTDLSKAELEALLEGEVDATNQAQAAKDLQAAFTDDMLAEMVEDVDKQLIGFNETYSAAFPDPNLTERTPEAIDQAMKAIDKAMANTNALRMKVSVINGLTGGAAGILAAIVPGTGAVVAAQKLVFDLIALQKCVETHNTWCDSMELSLIAQSAFSPAIERTLRDARIHLSRAAVKAVLDTLKVGLEVGRVFDPTGGTSIASTAVSMTGALVDYGYKMHGENAIRKGWNAYVHARANPKDRKAGRAALRMNSTLAKCCIAYGATIQNDTAAKEAIRATGLTIAALQDDKDICVRLIAYLENELADDPTVMKVEKSKSTKWHPGKPQLTIASWTAFKASASKSASPMMARDSLSTPAIDGAFAKLGASNYWKGKASLAQVMADIETSAKSAGLTQDMEFMQKAAALAHAEPPLQTLVAGFKGYRPVEAGAEGQPHAAMAEACKSFQTLAELTLNALAKEEAKLDMASAQADDDGPQNRQRR